MNLSEAIKTGKPFRRKASSDLWYEVKNGLVSYWSPSSDDWRPIALYAVEHLIADDWEIQEPSVTITRSQFWEAYYKALKLADSCGAFTMGKQPYMGELILQELGLEPKP